MSISGWSDEQRRALRSMSSSDKTAIASDLTEAHRAIAIAYIRARHPTYSEHEALWALWRMEHGDNVFQKVWPAAPLLEP